MAERPERVAFFGLGIMGGPMAANLARAGFGLAVYTRTREKAERFAAEHGARAAATPREAAEGAAAVVTMVPDAPEVEAVLLGEQGAVHGLEAGALAIDMSTIAPTAARAIGERLADDGVGFLEAPVSGSRPKAEDGTLTIMVGGGAEEVERARGLRLELLPVQQVPTRRARPATLRAGWRMAAALGDQREAHLGER
ncbi:MAG TPA: NAD(P)-dependent oxidoreductase, partial [Thermoleophilaceae bacterium]|nr:NAD(P)-dependent oxidoreductase [Thermoleophilaceae bacterium]